MSAVVITKGVDGKLEGLGEKGARAWGKFRRRVDRMQPGDTLSFTWREPRSQKHHGLFFHKLGALHDLQERFDCEEKLRAWLTVGAGYCDFAPGPDGQMVAIPQSIAWDQLDEADFQDLHRRVDAFLWTDHARGFLWPRLTAHQTCAVVEQFLQEFDR